MNLTLKNVPDNIYKVLKRTAAEQGRSLNSEAIRALQSFTDERERLRRMRESRDDLEKFVARMPKLKRGTLARIIREDRDSH